MNESTRANLTKNVEGFLRNPGSGAVSMYQSKNVNVVNGEFRVYGVIVAKAQRGGSILVNAAAENSKVASVRFAVRALRDRLALRVEFEGWATDRQPPIPGSGSFFQSVGYHPPTTGVDWEVEPVEDVYLVSVNVTPVLEANCADYGMSLTPDIRREVGETIVRSMQHLWPNLRGWSVRTEAPGRVVAPDSILLADGIDASPASRAALDRIVNDSINAVLIGDL